MKHLTSIADLSDDEIHDILAHARQLLERPERLLDSEIICMAFFEPSTRTRLSFEAATLRLGGQVIGFSDAASTSTAKGETLEDTIRILGGYADAIVLRHPEKGAATRAAAVSEVPIINAGDGDGEHPTQTLLDLFTMQQSYGDLADLHVAIIGDLRYGRTVHSLVPALRKMGAKVSSVAAPGLEMAGVPVLDLETAAARADVLYVTRVQQERFLEPDQYEAVKDAFLIDRGLLERTGSQATILHPLPRVGEVAADVDELPAAKYFDQAKNGLPVRMAVLAAALEAA